MPTLVEDALTTTGLMAAYQSRPPYQRNDYLSWINRAKLAPTKQKRLDQMLAELAAGDRDMNMAWRPGGAAPKRAAAPKKPLAPKKPTTRRKPEAE